MSCDPQTISDQAKCIQTCLPVGMQIPALIYLAAVKAGVTTDPTTLVDRAKCIECAIPIGMQMPVLISLAATISGDSSSASSLVNQARCIECAVPKGMWWAALLSVFCQQAGGNCDSQALATNAKCIECGMLAGFQMPVLIYLFATLAGASTDPQTLASNANCTLCGVSSGIELPVLISLACDFFLSPSGPAIPTNPDISAASTDGGLIITWSQSSAPDTNEVWKSTNGGAFVLLVSVAGGLTQTTDATVMAVNDLFTYKIRSVKNGVSSAFTSTFSAIKTPTLTGAISYPDVVLVVGNLVRIGDAAFTSISAPVLHSILGGLSFTNCGNLASILVPKLTSTGSISGISISGSNVLASITFDSLPSITPGNFFIFNNPSLASISAPVLTSIAGGLDLSGNFATTINLPLLASCGNGFEISSNDIGSLSLPSLTTVNGGFSAHDCGNLLTVSIPVLVFTNGTVITFDTCSLSSASVNAILARGVASGTTTCDYELDGGTNGSPSGQGIVDKTALIVAGNTVNTD